VPGARRSHPDALPTARLARLRGALGGFPRDDAWSEATALTLRRAQDGRDPEYPTAVQLLDTGTHLLVRFDCDDADVWATHTRRDAPLWEEEVVEIFLAAGEEDPRTYFEIQVNPLGAIFDARVANPDGVRATMTVDAGWDAAGLDARIHPTSRGWRADIAIPWAQMTEGEPPEVWRANFYRIERPRGRTAEFTGWSPTLADPPDFHRPSLFGMLLRDVRRS